MKRIKAFLMMMATVLVVSPAIAQDANSLILKPAPQVTGDAIHLGDVFDGAGSQAALVIGYASGTQSVLDAARVQQITQSLGLRWDNAKGVKRIIVARRSNPGTDPIEKAFLQNTTERGVDPYPAPRPKSLREVLVFTHPMSAGAVLSPDDLRLERPDNAESLTGLPAQASDVIGKTLKWPIRQGGIVRLIDVTSPIVIKHGETLRVTYQAQSLSLTLLGQAQKDGAVGDAITVMNPQSHKIFEAVVTAPGEALASLSVPRLATR